MPWAIAGGAIATLGAADAAKGGAEDSADAMMAALRKAYKAKEEGYNEGKQMLSPWTEHAARDYKVLREGIKTGKYDPGEFVFDASSLGKDAGYQFRLKEGENSLNKSLASRGKLFSSQQQKEFMDLNQNLASEETAAAYGRQAGAHNINALRKQTLYGIDTDIANTGKAATDQVVDMRQDLADAKANMFTGIGTQKSNVAQARAQHKQNMWNIAGQSGGAIYGMMPSGGGQAPTQAGQSYDDFSGYA